MTKNRCKQKWTLYLQLLQFKTSIYSYRKHIYRSEPCNESTEHVFLSNLREATLIIPLTIMLYVFDLVQYIILRQSLQWKGKINYRMPYKASMSQNAKSYIDDLKQAAFTSI